MSTIVPFLNSEAFDAEATAAMGKAFDDACKNLNGAGENKLVAEILAKRIIEAARSGERDPARLCAKALDTLGIAS